MRSAKYIAMLGAGVILALLCSSRAAPTAAFDGVIAPDGSPVSVTIASPGEDARLTFDGNAGQRVSAWLTNWSAQGCRVAHLSILEPDGRVIAGGDNCYGDTSQIFIDNTTLPVSGTYTLLLDPDGTTTGSGTLTLYDAPDVTGTIAADGMAVPVTTTTYGQNARLTFTGTAGQKVTARLTSWSVTGCRSVRLSILEPDGRVIGGGDNCYGDASQIFIDNTTLPVGGTYTLFLDPDGLTVGSGTLTLYNAPDVTGAIAADGTAISVTTTVFGQNARLIFQGVAGQQVSARLTGWSPQGCRTVRLSILQPDGRVIGGGDNCYGDTSQIFIDNTTLLIDGTYTLLLDPDGLTTGGGTLTLYNAPDVIGSIAADGADVSATTSVFGQNARLAFSGTAGQKVSARLTSWSVTNCRSVRLSILQPDGRVIAGGDNCYGDASQIFIDNTALPVTGTYTLFLDPDGLTTGGGTLALYDAPDVTGTIAPGGTAVSVTTTIYGQNGRLIFSGVTGQQVSAQLTDWTATTCRSVRLYLIQPDGRSIAGGDNCYGDDSRSFLDNATLPVDGTYTLLLDPDGLTTGSGNLTLYDATDVAGNITPGGALVPVTIAVPGQNARLTFQGTIGQQVSVRLTDWTSRSCRSVYLSILKPDGGVIASADNCYGDTSQIFIDNTRLPVDGTYTLLLNPDGTITGSGGMTLYNVSDVTGTIADYPGIAGGPPVKVDLLSPGQRARLTFQGDQGQQFFLRPATDDLGNVLNNTIGGDWTGDIVSILKPDGSVLVSTEIGTRSKYIGGTFTAPVAGTYTVLVDPLSTNTGSVTLVLFPPLSEVDAPPCRWGHTSGYPTNVIYNWGDRLQTPGTQWRVAFEAGLSDWNATNPNFLFSGPRTDITPMVLINTVDADNGTDGQTFQTCGGTVQVFGNVFYEPHTDNERHAIAGHELGHAALLGHLADPEPALMGNNPDRNRYFSPQDLDVRFIRRVYP